MYKVMLAVAIYFGEVAALSVLADSRAAYEGWGTYVTARPSHVAVSLLVLSGIVLLLESRPSTVRGLFFWWGFTTVLTPAWVLSDWTSYFPPEVASRAAFLVTLGFVTCLLASRLLASRRLVAPILDAPGFFLLVCIALAAAMFLLVLYLGAPSMSDLSLTTIYDRREEYTSNGVPRIAGYVMTWTSFVLVPAALVTAIRRRKPVLGVAAVVSGFAVFAWVGSKNTILLMGMTATVYLILRPIGRRTVRFPTLMPGLALLPVVIYLMTGSDQLVYFIARRALLVSAWNSAAHVEHGQSFDRTAGWLQSAVSGQGADSSIYGSIAVGQRLRPGTGLNANSHFLSYAMQWSSALAVIIVAVLTAVLLWVMDSAVVGRDQRIAVTIGAVASFNLSEFYLHTSILTGGILLALVFVVLAPPAARSSGDRRERDREESDSGSPAVSTA